jgi:hypothetical protein
MNKQAFMNGLAGAYKQYLTANPQVKEALYKEVLENRNLLPQPQMVTKQAEEGLPWGNIAAGAAGLGLGAAGMYGYNQLTGGGQQQQQPQQQMGYGAAPMGMGGGQPQYYQDPQTGAIYDMMTGQQVG